MKLKKIIAIYLISILGVIAIIIISLSLVSLWGDMERILLSLDNWSVIISSIIGGSLGGLFTYMGVLITLQKRDEEKKAEQYPRLEAYFDDEMIKDINISNISDKSRTIFVFSNDDLPRYTKKYEHFRKTKIVNSGTTFLKRYSDYTAFTNLKSLVIENFSLHPAFNVVISLKYPNGTIFHPIVFESMENVELSLDEILSNELKTVGESDFRIVFTNLGTSEWYSGLDYTRVTSLNLLGETIPSVFKKSAMPSSSKYIIGIIEYCDRFNRENTELELVVEYLDASGKTHFLRKKVYLNQEIVEMKGND